MTGIEPVGGVLPLNYRVIETWLVNRLGLQADVAPEPGLEPGTNELTARYSTN